MDLPVAKLEKFGLRNFINEYRFYLCKKTVNPLQVAAFLNLNADHYAAVTHPPDSFSKCEKLYELIQRKSEAKDFLEALDETGNEHILKFIKKTDFSTSGQTPSTSTNLNPSRRIWFNIPEPIDSFCGREDFLSQLHDQLKPRDDAETEVTVLSQVKVISGLGGIGKTQTARRYIMKYRQFYNNFIWIDAETEDSMANSFLKLAEDLKIHTKNSKGKPKDIDEIVKEIYNKICVGGKSTLIVFDNAEDYLSCKNFFPFGLHPDLTKPVILATSRNQEWKSTAGQIQVLPLDNLTEDESFEFILKQLEIPESEIPEFREESKEFIWFIGGLPLALQQAVAYIKQEKKANKLIGRPYRMSDYVQQFKSSSEKLQKLPRAYHSSTTVSDTWNLTFEKIQKEPQSKIAIELLELMSFLYADKIPIEFLFQLLPRPQNLTKWLWKLHEQQNLNFKSTDLVEGLNLLEKFSMIKITENFISIHRQLQFVILQYLKQSDDVSNVVMNIIDKCRGVLKNIQLSKRSDIFLNIHQIVNNPFNLIPVTDKFLDFMSEFGLALSKASRFTESLELYKKVYSKYLEFLGESHQKTLEAQHGIALQLSNLGRYKEALSLLEEVLKQQVTLFDFGVDHPLITASKHNMAKVLQQEGKYQEALKLLQQLLAQQNEILGENHMLTLSTQNEVAAVLLSLGKFPQALDLYKALERKRIETLGPDHQDFLMTKHKKATVLFRIGKVEEAAKIFNEVYEKRKEILGENHLETINTLECIAETLEKEEKVEEALELYKKVYEIIKINLGQDDPQTIRVKSIIVSSENEILEKDISWSKALNYEPHKDKETAISQISTPKDLKGKKKGSLVSQELKPSVEKRKSSSAIVGQFIYNTESAIKAKIKISLNFLCQETVGPVNFAMDLLSYKLLKEARFHELMSLDEGDFTLCYYLYVEILKLDSLDSLRKALEALNATENEHIVKYILFGQVGEVEQRQDTDDSLTSALNWTSAATENADVSQEGAERGSYNFKNPRVLFINQKFDARGKFSDKNYLEKRRDGADVDDVYMEQTFKQKPGVKFEVEENVTSEEIPGILNKFKRKCVDEGNDGFALFISTHGGKEPFSLLMDDLKWIHSDRDVVQKFSRAEFPAFSGKRKIFHFNAYQGQTEGGKTSEEPPFPASSIIDSDIFVGHSNQPYLFSHPGNADHPASN